MLSARTFGVEIECGHDQFNSEDVEEKLRENGFVGYDADQDGSGIEVRTPVYKGEKGYRELTGVMEYLAGIGCWVSRYDGMHVHVGAKTFYNDKGACGRLARTWYSNQALIESMVSSHRAGRQMCNKLARHEVDKLGQEGESYLSYDYRTGRYVNRRQKYWGERKSLNFSALEDHGTIEIRLHEGCLDPIKAVAWVKFCQKLIDYTYRGRRPLSCAKSKTALLTTLSVPPDAIAVLSRRQKLMPNNGRYGARY